MIERINPAPPLTVVVSRAQRDATTTLVVDGTTVVDKASALAAVAAGARFPAWVGHNLDAMADALGDLSWLDPGPVTVVWFRADRLWHLGSDERDGLLAVLADVEGADPSRPVHVILLDAPR